MTDANEARNRLLNGWQLSKMYTFEVAARHESFALAAEELSLSPSAPGQAKPPAMVFPLQADGTIDWDRGAFKVKAEFQ